MHMKDKKKLTSVRLVKYFKAPVKLKSDQTMLLFLDLLKVHWKTGIYPRRIRKETDR